MSLKYQVPYDENGKLIKRVIIANDIRFSANNTKVYEWKDNNPFYEKLKFKKMSNGEYSSYFVFENDHGVEFEMRTPDFIKCIFYMVNGIICGNFKYRKLNNTYYVIFDGFLC
jgi:hypothetical protein